MFYNDYKYILVPFLLWLAIQTSKVIVDCIEKKKITLRRLLGSGGMPSSHSAVMVSITVMLGKNIGFKSPIFALACFMTLVVMQDAIGVRRQVGKQAKYLNEILMDKNTSTEEKFQEMVGHTPFQVLIGLIVGLIAGLIA
jgi:acid phosphatase/vanadium-dependent haloperoxidase related